MPNSLCIYAILILIMFLLFPGHFNGRCGEQSPNGLYSQGKSLMANGFINYFFYWAVNVPVEKMPERKFFLQTSGAPFNIRLLFLINIIQKIKTTTKNYS